MFCYPTTLSIITLHSHNPISLSTSLGRLSSCLAPTDWNMLSNNNNNVVITSEALGAGQISVQWKLEWIRWSALFVSRQTKLLNCWYCLSAIQKFAFLDKSSMLTINECQIQLNCWHSAPYNCLYDYNHYHTKSF